MMEDIQLFRNVQFGLLDRRGNIILPPEYKDIYRCNEHEVVVKGNDGLAFYVLQTLLILFGIAKFFR